MKEKNNFLVAEKKKLRETESFSVGKFATKQLLKVLNVRFEHN